MKNNENGLKMNLQFFADGADEQEVIDEPEVVDEPETDEPEGGQQEKPKTEKTFTQKQVNRMMAKEKKDGRNAILKSLGISPNDPKADEKIKALASLNSLSGSTGGSAQEVVVNDKDAKMLLDSIIEAKAVRAGVSDEYVDYVKKLVMADIDVEDYTSDDIVEAITELKTPFAHMFNKNTAQDDKPKTGGKRGTGVLPNNSQGTGTQPKENFGAALAKKQRGNTGEQKSFFSSITKRV